MMWDGHFDERESIQTTQKASELCDQTGTGALSNR
jgi:hypothetical protein